MALEVLPRIFFIGADFDKIIQKDFIKDYSIIGGEIPAATKKRIKMANYVCLFSKNAVIKKALELDTYQKRLLDYVLFLDVNTKILIYSTSSEFFYELKRINDVKIFALKNGFNNININLKETLKNETVEENEDAKIKRMQYASFVTEEENIESFLKQSSTHSFQFEVNSSNFNKNILLLI
jgi:hypothetical protein